MVQKVPSSFLTARFAQDRPALVEAVVRWWIDNFPDAPLQFSLPHLGAMADAAVTKANQHQIFDQPDVCAFALLMWLYGPAFDEHPQIAKVLGSGMPSSDRIAQLFEDVPEPVWNAVDATRDEGRWFDAPTPAAVVER